MARPYDEGRDTVDAEPAHLGTRSLQARAVSGDQCSVGARQTRGNLRQIHRAQHVRQNGDVRAVASFDIADELEGLQRRELPIRGHERDCRERQCRRAGIEQARAVAQHIAAIGFAEGLAAQARNPLVVAPGISGKAVVHRTRALAGKQACRRKFDSEIRPGDELFEQRGGAVAPAAERIEQVGDGNGRGHGDLLEPQCGTRTLVDKYQQNIQNVCY